MLLLTTDYKGQVPQPVAKILLPEGMPLEGRADPAGPVQVKIELHHHSIIIMERSHDL